MSFPIFGSRCHSPIVVSCIRSSEITRILIFVEIRNIVHEFWLGSGKEALKSVSNCESVSQCHLGSLPKDLEGMSVIAFFLPSMCSGVSGDTPRSFMRRQSTRSSCPATNEPLAAMRCTQLTVGELSLKSAMWSPDASPHTSSMTSQRSSSPAHSKSELVSFPFLLPFVFHTSSLMSSGHSSRNTVGVHSLVCPTITPPTPCTDASFTPTYPGTPMTSSLHGVGVVADAFNSCLASAITISSALLRWR